MKRLLWIALPALLCLSCATAPTPGPSSNRACTRAGLAETPNLHELLCRYHSRYVMPSVVAPP